MWQTFTNSSTHIFRYFSMLITENTNATLYHPVVYLHRLHFIFVLIISKEKSAGILSIVKSEMRKSAIRRMPMNIEDCNFRNKKQREKRRKKASYVRMCSSTYFFRNFSFSMSSAVKNERNHHL